MKYQVIVDSDYGMDIVTVLTLDAAMTEAHRAECRNPGAHVTIEEVEG